MKATRTIYIARESYSDAGRGTRERMMSQSIVDLEKRYAGVHDPKLMGTTGLIGPE